MAHSKPLLIPWLRAQIDSCRYPGVQWTNPERTEFSVPWKHALRQDSCDTDILIFKAWAEVSGNGRAQGEASVWKRNFRSALRAKGFKTLDDNKNDPANPHKVFRFPEGAAAGRSAASQDQEDPTLVEDGVPVQDSQGELCIDGSHYIVEDDMFTSPPFTVSLTGEDLLQQCMAGLNIGLEPDGTAGFLAPPEQQQLQNAGVIGGHPLPGQQQYPVTFKGAGGEAGLPEQPAHLMEGAEGGVGNEQVARCFVRTVNKTVDGGVFNTQFNVKVYYRGVKVCEQLVTNEAGVRLVYRPDLLAPVVDPESGLTLVSLPGPAAMLDQTQARLTQCILDRLDSLDVGVSGPVVYGQRLGEIKAFWSLSKFNQGTEPQEVPKHPQPLYTLHDFTQGIIKFINDGECPPCSLFFCIGEKWPDPNNRPWEKKLITVEVVLTSVELLKTLAVQGGSSSLRSVELQISLEKMMEM
ncbi:interferon regulatory factor 3 [Betta splendens]|uniref:Interferon regulatory factor 3 n=1 Tax=Betta splendens TaxID=158456 RepID=A0A6P7L2Z6_BETSP|nr:interferon regulatory factor 3 [Betta splendens]